MKRHVPPTSLQALLHTCQHIAGITLGELAHQNAVILPGNLRAGKGKVGQLLEKALGATMTSQAVPDFPHLGVELKTLPVKASGQPSESTYVCTAPLRPTDLHWATCWVRRKLGCVLWVPIEADTTIPLAERRIGRARLWRPSSTEEQQLQQDWELLTQHLWFGGLAQLDARLGHILHIRPKAAHSQILTASYSEACLTVPKGFYLRPSFTKQFAL